MAELKRIVQKNEKFSHNMLFWATTISMTVYIMWRLVFTIPTRFGPVAFALGLLLLAAEFTSVIEALIEYRQIKSNTALELPEIPLDWYPHIDILIATHNESVELLYKTVNACTFLKYPDKNKVHIYLCDDTNRPEMADLARDFGVGYFGLSDNKHAKAGNLNNALKRTDSLLVTTFDADMIPHSDFLIKTVPYFSLPKIKKNDQGIWVERSETEIIPDYKIGFIQTPQSFYNPDLFQHYLYSEQRIPNEQDYFFRKVNVGRNVDNAVIYAGSNTVLSRKALEEVGYLATTSITEDFLTGLRIQKEGYTAYATSEILAHGLSPESFKGLIKQRERWGRGCIQSLRQAYFILTPKLKLAQKISYLSTLLYWWTYARRLIYMLAPILSIIFNLSIIEADIQTILVFWLPSYLLYNRALRELSGELRSQHWSDVFDTILSPYLVGPILLESMGIKKRKFVVTEKKKQQLSDKVVRRMSVLFAIPFVVMLGLSLWTLVLLIITSINIRTIYNPVIMYWIIINIKNLIFALFFMHGRTNNRTAELFHVKIPAVICTGAGEFEGKTSYVSEIDVEVLLGKPIDITPDEPLKVIVSSKGYEAALFCSLSDATQSGQNWKYHFRIDLMNLENKRQYMQIVYDREHTLPKKLKPSISVFDDLKLNLVRHTRREDQTQNALNLPFEVE